MKRVKIKDAVLYQTAIAAIAIRYWRSGRHPRNILAQGSVYATKNWSRGSGQGEESRSSQWLSQTLSILSANSGNSRRHRFRLDRLGCLLRHWERISLLGRPPGIVA